MFFFSTDEGGLYLNIFYEYSPTSSSTPTVPDIAMYTVYASIQSTPEKYVNDRLSMISAVLKTV